MARDLDIRYIQQEIIDFLDTNRPHVKHIVDGLVDGEAPETTSSGAIKPFVVVWFRSLRRSGARRGTRAVSGARMDAYTLGFDLVCVASDGTSARAMVNDYNDILIGRKFQHTGQLVTDAALWENSRPVIDAQNRPTRWAASTRFNFSVAPRQAETIIG